MMSKDFAAQILKAVPFVPQFSQQRGLSPQPNREIPSSLLRLVSWESGSGKEHGNDYHGLYRDDYKDPFLADRRPVLERCMHHLSGSPFLH